MAISLIPQARQATKMWSVRLAAIAAGLGALEPVLPTLSGIVPDGVLGTLSVLSAAGAAVARVIKQHNLQ